MRHFWRCCFAIAGFAFLTGCGGGGKKPIDGLGPGSLTGVVTDVDGSAIAAAAVRVGSRETLSLSNGSFELYNLEPGYQRLFASTTINGVRWSGETIVDIAGESHNRNANIVLSREVDQGALEGTVVDTRGRPIPEAKVFVQGPVASTLAITDSRGRYTAPRLTSAVTYTVTASLAGFINDTKDIRIPPQQTAVGNFTLTEGGPLGALPAPRNVIAQAWTVSTDITRAENPARALYEAIKRLYRIRKGLPPAARSSRIERRGEKSRDTPVGSLIEVDLFWDYELFEDMFGYSIRRATRASALTDPLSETALVRDPLTSVFFDIDFLLTPDVTYYYTVHRLETIDFPPNGLIGPPSEIVSSIPMQPIRTQSPAFGQEVRGTPTFRWTAANRAASYKIYLWDRFPSLNSSTDPDGAQSIWTGPGSQVSAPAVSRTYDGPALQAGRTYYWMVVASDADVTALSATEIARFVAR